MEGFERFTVLDPKTSKEVRKKLQTGDPTQGLPLTLSPETVEGVVQLRSETIVEVFHRRYAKFEIDEIIYDGHSDQGDHIKLTVLINGAESSPATVTIVRRAAPSP